MEDNSFIVNSLLNLDNRELEIKGANYISISDSQKVYIQPYGGLIKVKKNRDFDFSGKNFRWIRKIYLIWSRI